MLAVMNVTNLNMGDGNKLNVLTKKNDDNNGLAVNGVSVPEIVTSIIAMLDSKTLLNCRLVCKSWKDIIDNSVWKMKVKYDGFVSYSRLAEKEKDVFNIPWPISYCVQTYDPFNKNLLKNSCGQGGFAHWKIKDLDHWFTNEKLDLGIPMAVHPDLVGVTNWFTLVNITFPKKQLIDLRENGITGYIMDNYAPFIFANDWFVLASPVIFKYILKVSLLGEDMRLIACQSYKAKVYPPLQGNWYRAAIQFCCYERGVRYIEFSHGGSNAFPATTEELSRMQFSGSSVIVALPFGSTRILRERHSSEFPYTNEKYWRRMTRSRYY